MNAFRKCSLRLFRSNNSSYLKISPTIKCEGLSSTKQPLKKTTLTTPVIPNAYLVKKLQDLFKIKKSVASNIIIDHKTFSEVAVKDIVQVFQTCINAGIKKENLLEHVEILTTSEIEEKLELLKKLPHTLANTFPLLVLSKRLLSNFIMQEEIEKRIQFLSKLFDVKIGEVCNMLSQRPFLLTLNLDHMKESFDLLRSYGITKEEICKDLWVLKYSIKNIEAKLEFAHENNMDNVKTWMVRVPVHIFENSIKRRSDNQSILGKNSFIEYLSEKLQCSQELAKAIISKHPAIQHKSLKKINEMIDFLLSKGFSTEHVCRTPKILLHSVDTIRSRLNIIEQQGAQLTSLSVCTKSKKQFTQFLESITSDKNKKNVSSI